MKIILENELEKWAWDVMISAHYKWEKNHGMILYDLMEWYFYDVFKDETEEAIKKEVERRLRDEFGKEFFTIEDEYVKSGSEAYSDDDFTDEKKNELERDLREEYKEVHKDISEERENVQEEVKYKLSQIYYTFFNAPEKLTVIYNGEVIQGKV